MNLNQVHSFLAITKTLNFTAAARQLGIPQSTISRQINDLEGQLGVRLFYRTKRDVSLTDEGKTFLPFAREISEAADKGVRAVRELHEGGAGHLSVAVAPACERFVCECLDAFHEKYPDIVVDIDRITAGYTLMDNLDSTHDFYFLYSEMFAAGDEYDSMTTHSEAIGIASGKALMDGSKDPADVIPERDVILMSEESDPILYMQAMNYCRTRRFTPRIVNSFSDTGALMLALRSGMGVAFVPASLIEGGDEAIDFRPLDDDSYSIRCIAAWKNSLLNPAASLFLEILREKAR